MFRFTLCDLLWFFLALALVLMVWRERRAARDEKVEFDHQRAVLLKNWEDNPGMFLSPESKEKLRTALGPAMPIPPPLGRILPELVRAVEEQQDRVGAGSDGKMDKAVPADQVRSHAVCRPPREFVVAEIRHFRSNPLIQVLAGDGCYFACHIRRVAFLMPLLSEAT